jgi:hypothetical protein
MISGHLKRYFIDSERLRQMLVTLPDKGEMCRRLNTVIGDDDTRKAFYPLILERAGQEFSAEAIVVFLRQAMMQYALSYSHTTAAEFEAQMPAFIEALVDDRIARSSAIIFWQSSR